MIVLEGDAFLYRAALAILGVLESRLFFPEKKELLELLRCAAVYFISWYVVRLIRLGQRGKQGGAGSRQAGRAHDR